MRWRMEVIGCVFGDQSPYDTATLAAANADYYAQALANGTHIAVIAGMDVHDVGCASVCLQRELPSPDNPTGLCAYVMNVYVRPQARRHGVAHAMVRYLTDKARNLGCGKIWLESTDSALSIYTDLGFEPQKHIMKL